MSAFVVHFGMKNILQNNVKKMMRGWEKGSRNRSEKIDVEFWLIEGRRGCWEDGDANDGKIFMEEKIKNDNFECFVKSSGCYG